MTKNTSRSTMGGSEKSRFFDYFFRTIGDFISKNSVFLRILQVLQNRCPRSNRNFFIFLSKKNVNILNMWCQKYMNFQNMTLKYFHIFWKKLKKKWFFCTSLTYRKSEEKHKKMMFFWKITKITFELTMGGSWKKLKTNLSVSPL